MTTNIFTPLIAYENLKAKTQKDIQGVTHFNELFNILLSMFEYDNLPDNLDNFDTRYIDSILCSTGQIACGIIDDKLTFAPCTLGGQVDAYGLGTDVIAPTPIGDIRGKRNIDVAYGINNKLATPDTMIYWLSSLMAETDTSMKMNILYTRLLNIPIVNDEKAKNAVTEIYKKLLNGEELTAIISGNIFNDLVEKDIHTIELTDANKIDRIQYLSRFYDDLVKRFANTYGQALQTQNKSAQTQTDELHGFDSYSFIIPLEMYQCRKEFIDNINRIFGYNITVSFSKSWAYELARFETRDLNENGINDIEEIDENITVDNEELETPIDEESDKLDLQGLTADDIKTIRDLIEELKQEENEEKSKGGED